MINVVNAIVFHNGAVPPMILLVKKKDTWILPGGKSDADEDHFDCLVREFKEELSLKDCSILSSDARPYQQFKGESPNRKLPVVVTCWFLVINPTRLTPRSEISQYIWTNQPERLPLSPITREIITALRSDGYFEHPVASHSQ